MPDTGTLVHAGGVGPGAALLRTSASYLGMLGPRHLSPPQSDSDKEVSCKVICGDRKKATRMSTI